MRTVRFVQYLSTSITPFLTHVPLTMRRTIWLHHRCALLWARGRGWLTSFYVHASSVDTDGRSGHRTQKRRIRQLMCATLHA